MALTFTPPAPVAAPTDQAVLEIDSLSVGFGPKGRERRVVEDLSLTVRPGQVVALVGESGSGKSTTAHATLGLLPAGGRIVGGRITLGGHDVTSSDDKAFRHHRGPLVGLVPQDPMVALNPTMRIGEQVAEAVRRRGVPKRSVGVEVAEVLERAGVDDPAVKARQYPHELSGGQRQRVLIAIALAGRPRLFVADEPTSALDATVQRRILDHLDRLVADSGISLLLITHDLGIAVDRADHLVVMSQGRIVEQGRPADVVAAPQHEYTQRLLDAAPGLGRIRRPAPVPPVDDVVLRFDGVSKEFTSRSGFGSRSRARVLDDVTLDVHRGRTLALVGESGSGKTTALRIAMGLERPDLGSRAVRRCRRRVVRPARAPWAAPPVPVRAPEPVRRTRPEVQRARPDRRAARVVPDRRSVLTHRRGHQAARPGRAAGELSRPPRRGAVGRAAATRRDRPCARPRARAAAARRAGVGAGRVGAGADPRPARRPADASSA